MALNYPTSVGPALLCPVHHPAAKVKACAEHPDGCLSVPRSLLESCQWWSADVKLVDAREVKARDVQLSKLVGVATSDRTWELSKNITGDFFLKKNES